MATTNYLNHEQSVRQSGVNNQHHHHHHHHYQQQQLSEQQQQLSRQQQQQQQQQHDRYLQSRFNIDLFLINPRDHILLEQVIQLIAHCAFRETVAPEELLGHAAVNAQRRGVLVYDDDDDDDEDKKDDDDEKDTKDDNRNVDDDDSDVKGVI